MRRSLSADALFRDALETFRRKGSAEQMLEEAYNHVAERVREARTQCWDFEITPNLRRPYILSNYRRDHDLKACVRSLLMLHNETINVWSHLVGGALFGYQLYSTAMSPCDDDEVCAEKWPIYCFLVSALVCLSLSAVYHLCGTANERWTDSLANLDYMGIVALIVGSCMPVCWYGFGPDFPVHRAVYLGSIVALGAAVITCSFTSWFDRGSAHILLFIGLALAGVCAILHAILLHDYNPAVLALLRGVMQMGLIYMVGVGVYATHFPESVAPSRFLDVFGSSHQWWHLAVVVAAMQHFHVVLQLWRSAATLTAAMVQQQDCDDALAVAPAGMLMSMSAANASAS